MVFPAAKAGEESLLEKGAKKLGLVKGGAKEEVTAGGLQGQAGSDAGMSIDELSHLFKPVLFTTPPEPDVPLVNDNNREYVNSLRELQRDLEAMQASSPEDGTAAFQKAREALQQTHKAHDDLADKFSGVGSEDLSKPLADLLAQPIQLAEKVIPKKPENPSITKNNSGLAQVCAAIAPILKTFPFNLKADREADLRELAQDFGPNGKILRYAQGSELLKRTGQKWESTAGGLAVSQDLLDFLSRTQQLSDALFGASGTEPRLRYTLRPVHGSGAVVLVLDGKTINSGETSLQTSFSWPASGGGKPGASGTAIRSDSTTPFGSYATAWGTIRLFQSAEPRGLGNANVEWSHVRGLGPADSQSFSPPAKIELMDFSPGIDLFNPQYFEPLRRCPQLAVKPN
jgi:type VI protein secretion system component VasK